MNETVSKEDALAKQVFEAIEVFFTEDTLYCNGYRGGDIKARIAGAIRNSEEWAGLTELKKVLELREDSLNEVLTREARSLRRVQELTDTFRHTHSAVGMPRGVDQCAECGLDLRDSIHTRVDPDSR